MKKVCISQTDVEIKAEPKGSTDVDDMIYDDESIKLISER